MAIPTRADGPLEIGTTDAKMHIDVALHGAKSSVQAAVTGGNVVYVGGDARGGHVVQTVVHDGVESFVEFDHTPAEAVTFDVSMTNVKGLRLVSNVLEFLDGSGTPRLRMQAPVLIDSAGQVTQVSVTLPDCAYDDSPAAPWDRKIMPPGATTCTVHLAWPDAGLTYPVLLDPTWSTTGSMTTPRRWHGAILLSTLKVLAIGGEGSSLSYLTTSELYDPATQTWATTGEMRTARRRFTTTAIVGGKILAAGGETSFGRTAGAELYDPATGRWAPTGAMTTARSYHGAVRLGSGQVLIAGGIDASGFVLPSAELYDPSSGTFNVTGPLGTGRHGLSLNVLGSGKVLAAGGVDGASNVLSSAELYDPATGSWTATGAMLAARQRHRSVTLDDGSVLVSGGYIDAAATTTTKVVEAYDEFLGRFLDKNVVGPQRADHGMLATPENTALIVGGIPGSGATPLRDTPILDANNTKVTATGTLRVPHAQHSTTLMGNGYVLVAGGLTNATTITNVAERSGPYLHVYGANGAAHQIQFTSVSGSWDTGFSFSILYDSTPFNVAYDWIGTSLRATVTDAQGIPLGTVVVAQKGDATFTSADGSQQISENRNLVTAHDISFMNEKVVILGPQTIFLGKVTNKLSDIFRPPPWLTEWLFTVRESVFWMSYTDQGNLWRALTEITADTSKTFRVRADIEYDPQNGNPAGGYIEKEDCLTVAGPDYLLCPAGYPITYAASGQAFSWYDVDVVRAHWEIDHDIYPQFFKHHRRYLDKMEAWIKNPGGWQDTNGLYVLPYGYMPYWNPAGQIPDNPGNQTADNFRKKQIPARNCDGTNNTSLTTRGKVDTYITFNNISGCDWFSHLDFVDPTYTFPLPGGSSGICSGAGTADGDANWFFPFNASSTDPTTAGCLDQSIPSNCNSSLKGIHCWHDCVHAGVEGFNLGQPFSSLDAPGAPVFFLWHAFVDTIYGQRLDCP